MKPLIGALLGAVVWAGSGRAEDTQRRVLQDVPEKGRFTLTDRDWPSEPGAASICLWKDDVIAPLTITVDDNWAADHSWWLEMGDKYGVRVTWFVISGRVSGPNAFNGTWEGFQKLVTAGHDVQSHTVTHLHTEEPGWKGVDWEYAESVKQIEAGLPGHRVVALAYPGGKNSDLNDPAIAAKFYIGGRGTTGSMNPAHKINYLCCNSVGGIPRLGDAKFESQDLLSALEKGRAKNPSLYRAWYCNHFHGVNKPEDRAQAEQVFAALSERAKAGDLWLALFKDVIRYGQQRDTAKLEVEAGQDTIVVRVTDAMDDTLFDFPLTVKVRLPAHWDTVKGGRLIEHGGAKFALVDVVPDRGEVRLTPR